MISASAGGPAVAADHVVRVDEVTAHLAVERGCHLSVAEVEPGERDLRLGAEDVRLGRLLLEDPVVDLDLSGGVLLQEGGVAPDLEMGVVARRLGGLQLRLAPAGAGPCTGPAGR